MKLQTRLLLAPCLTAAVALGAAGLNAWLADRAAQSVGNRFQHNFENFRRLNQAQHQLGQMQIEAYHTVVLVASLDETALKAVRSKLKQQADGVRQQLQSLTEAAPNPTAAATLERLGPSLGAYAHQIDDAIDLASVDPNTGAAALHTADTNFQQMTNALGSLLTQMDELAKAEHDDAVTEGRQASGLLLGLGILATLAVLAGSILMLRRLAQALGEATALALAVAEGDLSRQEPTERQDEIGALQHGLGQMVVRLSASLGTVHRVAQDIAGAGSEIATGNQDLSHRTEQAASSLQETASAMEELTTTVRQSAESAEQANVLAGSASEVAQRGGAAVARVVRTMEDINSASRKIEDIVSVIDGIAFQTNLLALNAAVQAARAGEQGRGFAVVAGEVRSLAGRSAEAAREIKGLIKDSVERVAQGAEQVQAAGQTMEEIVASVNRVGQIIADISHSSRDQSNGIGQINASVSRLDQVTQQNAALVEQSAAAAESLKEQAAQLTQVVGAFRLQASDTAMH